MPHTRRGKHRQCFVRCFGLLVVCIPSGPQLATAIYVSLLFFPLTYKIMKRLLHLVGNGKAAIMVAIKDKLVLAALLQGKFDSHIQILLSCPIKKKRKKKKKKSLFVKKNMSSKIIHTKCVGVYT